MPNIERIIYLPYQEKTECFTVTASSDAKAIIDAIHELEKREGKMRGALKKYFSERIKDITVVIK